MTELTPFAIYLIFTADHVRIATMIVAFVCLVVSIIAWIWALDSDNEPEPARTIARRLTTAVVVCLAVVALTPSTGTLVAMYGIPAAIEGAKSAATSEVGQKAYSAVNKLLDGYLSDKAK